jgi:signal transduction histidine kinase
LVSHLAVAGGVYALTDRRPVDTVVKHTGFFQLDTTKVLATTVESLREENRLQVFSYKGTARVQTERSRWWLFGGRQELIVPAVVDYYVDLSRLTLADVTYNEAQKLVTVHLPALSIRDIVFQPENATTINGGVLTFMQGEVEELQRLNYRSARRAVAAQAQQAGLINAAKRQAVENVTSYFEIPLRIAGQPDVKVAATFN